MWNLFFSSLLLPLIGIVLLWRRNRRPLGGWLATLLLAGGLTGFSVLAAPWGWFGVPLRYVLLLLFIVAIVMSLRRPPDPQPPAESFFRVAGKMLIGLFFGSVALTALSARGAPERRVPLAMPLRGGTFLVAHGGSTPAANIHAAHAVQRFAVDFVQLNAAGMRASGVLPSDPNDYAIFGAEVVSPCDGTVAAAADAFPDHRPPGRDEKNAAGNTVVVRCGDVLVHLEHLQRGSVAVKPGAAVRRGDVLGRVGNSGNSTEPHLHVYATRNGAAEAMTFDGRWLVRNAVVRK